MPTETQMDITKRIATTRTRAIHKNRKYIQTFQGRHGEVLHKLEKIFVATADQVPSTPTHTTQSSSPPTGQTQICLSQQTHRRVTRANTPGIIPVDPTPPENIPLTQPSEGVNIPAS